MSLQSHVNCYGGYSLRKFFVLGAAYAFNIGKLCLVCKYIDLRYACKPEYCVLGNAINNLKAEEINITYFWIVAI
jgi:hypothetical protein